MKQSTYVRFGALAGFLLAAVLVFQNCGDVRVKGFENPPPPPTAYDPPPPQPPQEPGQPPPQVPPKVVDGGTSEGVLDLGLSTQYTPFQWVEWTPTGHFLITGPCSPIRTITPGWPGGQYLFSAEGKFLAMSHVCRDSGYSGSCPEGQGCQLGEKIYFVNSNTFVRIAQKINAAGAQRAPMLYKISNNSMQFLGQAFKPEFQFESVNYPEDAFIGYGAVVGDTFLALKTGRKDSAVPVPAPEPPYRMSFYQINLEAGQPSFEHTADYSDYSPKTIVPVHSVGPFVIGVPHATGFSKDIPAKVYRLTGTNLEFVKDLVPIFATQHTDILKDSMDRNVFYVKPVANPESLRKYRFQEDTIVDLGLISPGPGERLVTVSGNVVVKVKGDKYVGDCSQDAQIIVEMDGRALEMPPLFYDQNEKTNQFCQKNPSSLSCKDLTLPLPTPGPQCRSEPYINSAAIRNDGKLILYVERITERFRILRIQ